MTGRMHASMTVDIHVDPPFHAIVDVDLLQDAAVATLRTQGIEQASLTIVVTDDASVQALNRQYRNIDAPTDVLSFAAQESLDAAPALILPPELDTQFGAFLGDVIIALPYVERQAVAHASSLAAELRLLTVHGVLHLLGYDHASEEEEAVMWAAQDTVLATFGQATPAARDHA